MKKTTTRASSIWTSFLY